MMKVEPDGLGEPVLSGIRWSSLSQYGQHALTLSTAAVLSRLLTPADFGLFSMALVFTRLPLMFRDLGTSSAVIQHPAPSQTLLSSLFWLNVAFGALAAAVVWAVAPVAASFYREPALTGLLRALSAVLLFWGPRALPQALLERELRFAPLARAELLGAGFGAAAAVGLGLSGAGLWCLAAQLIVAAGVTSFLIWRASPWRPRAIFQWSALRGVVGYSAGLTAFNALDFLSRNADNVIIGRVLGPTALGYYTLAYTLMLVPLQAVSAVVGRAVFPAYARMQADLALFRRTFVQVSTMVAMASFPMMLGLSALCRPFILAIYGPRWEPVAELFLILAPVGMIHSILTMNGAIYRVTGRMARQLAMEAATVCVLLFAFSAGLSGGVRGVALAYTAASFLLALPAAAAAYSLIGLSVREVAVGLLRPLAVALIVAGALTALRAALPAAAAPAVVLALGLSLGAAVFFITARRLLRPDWERLQALLRP